MGSHAPKEEHITPALRPRFVEGSAGIFAAMAVHMDASSSLPAFCCLQTLSKELERFATGSSALDHKKRSSTVCKHFWHPCRHVNKQELMAETIPLLGHHRVQGKLN
jgi:hypothetical protein